MCARIMPSDGWRPIEDPVLKGIKRHDALNRPDEFRHLPDLTMRDKYG